MRIVDQVMGVPMTTRFGSFLSGAYRVLDDRTQSHTDHMLLYLNLEIEPCNLRLNSACFTSGILGDIRCDCSWQLEFALGYVQQQQQGLVMYHLDHEGRGNGLVAKLRSFASTTDDDEHGARAYASIGLPSDAREFESATVILRTLGIRSVNLISDNQAKRRALREAGIHVANCLPAGHTARTRVATTTDGG